MSLNKQALIANLSGRVDAQLKAILSSRDMELYKMMSYHLGWGGRPGDQQPVTTPKPAFRLHGTGCLVASQAISGSFDNSVPAAVAVELLASFVEIHDDIQGGHPQRNGRDAVWWIWGPAQAINAGDGMHALARLAILELGREGVDADITFAATKTLDQASLEMCEGRFKDMESQERIDMSVENYVAMARAKSGSLLAGALQLGALIGSRGDERTAAAFAECGAHLGIAMQASSDVRELFGTNTDPESAGPLSEEVLNKKKLLPVVHAIEQADAKQRRRLGDVYFKRVLEPADIAEIRQIVEDVGGRKRADEIARNHGKEAMLSIKEIDLEDDGSIILEAFVNTLIGIG